MAIKITITIDDVSEVFAQRAPWLGRVMSRLGFIDRETRVAEKLSEEIKKNLLVHNIKSRIEYAVQKEEGNS